MLNKYLLLHKADINSAKYYSQHSLDTLYSFPWWGDSSISRISG